MDPRIQFLHPIEIQMVSFLRRSLDLDHTAKATRSGRSAGPVLREIVTKRPELKDVLSPEQIVYQLSHLKCVYQDWFRDAGHRRFYEYARRRFDQLACWLELVNLAGEINRVTPSAIRGFVSFVDSTAELSWWPYQPPKKGAFEALMRIFSGGRSAVPLRAREMCNFLESFDFESASPFQMSYSDGPGSDVWMSPAGIRYSMAFHPDSICHVWSFHSILHVMTRGIEGLPFRPHRSTFADGGGRAIHFDEILPLVDQAWIRCPPEPIMILPNEYRYSSRIARRSSSQVIREVIGSPTLDLFLVPMGECIGKGGEDHIAIVVDSGTSSLKAAYPAFSQRDPRNSNFHSGTLWISSAESEAIFDLAIDEEHGPTRWPREYWPSTDECRQLHEEGVDFVPFPFGDFSFWHHSSDGCLMFDEFVWGIREFERILRTSRSGEKNLSLKELSASRRAILGSRHLQQDHADFLQFMDRVSSTISRAEKARQGLVLLTN